jgi:hypothetical protein
MVGRAPRLCSRRASGRACCVAVWKGEEEDEGGLLASVLEHVSEKLGSMRHVSTEGNLSILWQGGGR